MIGDDQHENAVYCLENEFDNLFSTKSSECILAVDKILNLNQPESKRFLLKLFQVVFPIQDNIQLELARWLHKFFCGQKSCDPISLYLIVGLEGFLQSFERVIGSKIKQPNLLFEILPVLSAKFKYLTSKKLDFLDIERYTIDRLCSIGWAAANLLPFLIVLKDIRFVSSAAIVAIIENSIQSVLGGFGDLKIKNDLPLIFHHLISLAYTKPLKIKIIESLLKVFKVSDPKASIAIVNHLIFLFSQSNELASTFIKVIFKKFNGSITDLPIPAIVLLLATSNSPQFLETVLETIAKRLIKNIIDNKRRSSLLQRESGLKFKSEGAVLVEEYLILLVRAIPQDYEGPIKGCLKLANRLLEQPDCIEEGLHLFKAFFTFHPFSRYELLSLSLALHQSNLLTILFDFYSNDPQIFRDPLVLKTIKSAVLNPKFDISELQSLTDELLKMRSIHEFILDTLVDASKRFLQPSRSDRIQVLKIICKIKDKSQSEPFNQVLSSLMKHLVDSLIFNEKAKLYHQIDNETADPSIIQSFLLVFNLKSLLSNFDLFDTSEPWPLFFRLLSNRLFLRNLSHLSSSPFPHFFLLVEAGIARDFKKMMKDLIEHLTLSASLSNLIAQKSPTQLALITGHFDCCIEFVFVNNTFGPNSSLESSLLQSKMISKLITCREEFIALYPSKPFSFPINLELCSALLASFNFENFNSNLGTFAYVIDKLLELDEGLITNDTLKSLFIKVSSRALPLLDQTRIKMLVPKIITVICKFSLSNDQFNTELFALLSWLNEPMQESFVKPLNSLMSHLSSFTQTSEKLPFSLIEKICGNHEQQISKSAVPFLLKHAFKEVANDICNASIVNYGLVSSDPEAANFNHFRVRYKFLTKHTIPQALASLFDCLQSKTNEAAWMVSNGLEINDFFVESLLINEIVDYLVILTRASVYGNAADRLLNLLTSLYRLVPMLLKSTGSCTKMATLITLLNAKLNPQIFALLPIVQQLESEDAKEQTIEKKNKRSGTTTGLSRIKKQGRLVSALIFAMETFESSYINFLDQNGRGHGVWPVIISRSTARDFKIRFENLESGLLA